MGSLSIWHWLIIAVVFVMFFGAKRMPDAARSLGRSLRIFKSEVSQMQQEGKDAEAPAAPAQQPAQPQQLPPAQQAAPTVAQQPHAEPKSL
ncbi:twin-arginine translocase TatA/TatE family subunit [Nocardia brasiliensis]|uniref:Sec-independent protein translocase protein TatA n=1 Tax=Nocardia brasiliensis TaxID=37326 RepID=A0A6G9XUR1_NOCBR|nr:Sec-independent protein translocase subunit TatA [Nocardia brasiliensis]QIS04573.1 twin-arginine translocase TatA/TatE family subunit [Nocardia brasiliensis]